MSKNNLECDISVILPVYKPDKIFFKKAVESILNQTKKEFELLIIYERSNKDIDVFSMIDSYQDERMRVIVTPERFGLPAALNLGINESKGKYIARMDADDIALKRRLEVQYKFMEKNRKITVLGGVAKFIGSEGYSLMNDFNDQKIRKIMFLLTANCGINHPTAFIRKSFLIETGLRYDISFSSGEDYKFWVDCLQCGGVIYCLDEVVLYYRVHCNQLTQINKKDNYTFRIKKELLEQLGAFSNQEINYSIKLFQYDSDIKAKNAYKIIKKIIKLNKTKKIYPTGLLRKVALYEWLKKALSNIKHNKKLEFFLSPFLLWLFWPPDLIYVILNLIRGRRKWVPKKI